MKNYQWTDYTAPVITKVSDGFVSFYDHPDLLDLAPGDIVHYEDKDSRITYEVVRVELANERDYDERLRKVTARRIR